jgi:hypothetical protein
MPEDIKYENIAVLSPIKRRFLKHYDTVKQGKPQYYIGDFLSELLDLYEKKGGK